jgi:hypothetical protein
MTNALESLKSSLSTVRELHNLESKFPDPPPPHLQNLSQGLRGGAIVLTLASFEGFLGELFEEELSRVQAEGIPLVHYAEKFQVNSAFLSLSYAVAGDYDSKGKSKASRLNEVVAIARQVGSRSFSPRSLALTQSNPNSNTVKRMFGDVGFLDLFRTIHPDFEAAWGPAALDFVPEKLDALVRQRNQVAHTAAMAHIARSDVEQGLLLVYVLSGVLSGTLSNHIGGLIHDAKTSMAGNP